MALLLFYLAWYGKIIIQAVNRGPGKKKEHPSQTFSYPEIEFWDIKVTKDSVLLLYDIPIFTVPSISGSYRKTIFYSGLKIHSKKSAKQENSSLFMNSIY